MSAFKRMAKILNKDLQKIGKDNKTAVELLQPPTKEQIIQNTSMAPKPPNAPVNTSGRPPVAPQGPEPAQESSLIDEGPALNATMMPGGQDPWAQPPSRRRAPPDKMKAYIRRFSSKDPWADEYKLGQREEEELARYTTMNRRDFGNVLESRIQHGEIGQNKANRYRREYDRRRR